MDVEKRHSKAHGALAGLTRIPEAGSTKAAQQDTVLFTQLRMSSFVLNEDAIFLQSFYIAISSSVMLWHGLFRAVCQCLGPEGGSLCAVPDLYYERTADRARGEGVEELG